MNGWLDMLWNQAFRDELVIAPERFARGNFAIGIFMAIVLYANARHPERTNLLLTALVALSMVAHLSGLPISAAFPRATASVLYFQGLALFATTAALVAMSAWLTFHATTLANVRYLPGIALSLFVYAALEIHFFGPHRLQRLNVRRLGIWLGITAELALAACLVRHLLQS